VKVASIARPGLRLTLNPPVAPLVLDRRTKHKMTWPPFRVPVMLLALPVPMKQPHQVPPSIVCVVIVKMESTKPMVLLLDPVVIFVRLGLHLRPSPPVAPLVLDQRTKLKMQLLLLPVPIIQRAPLAKKVQHQHHPLIVSVPIVMPITIKMTLSLQELRAHRGPPAEPVKRDPHRPPPSIVPVPHAPIPNTKQTQHTRVRRVRIGPNAPLAKKAPHQRCPSIGFVPLVIPDNSKLPLISLGRRAPIGTPVPRAKKEQHQVQPPTLLAVLAPMAIFKLKLVTN